MKILNRANKDVENDVPMRYGKWHLVRWICWSLVPAKRHKNDESEQRDADGVDLTQIKATRV